MNLESLYYVSQIIAAVAVIASVLFLARQVRENTTTVRATANREASLGWSEFNRILSAHPFHIAFSRTFDIEAKIADFSEPEQQSIYYLGRAMMQRFESEYFQFSAGLLGSTL
ncbi:MAG: hypothetical protein AB7Q76_18710 [Gammaproteobacteria bacterium]